MREREYGKYSTERLKKPELSANSGPPMCCVTLGNHSPLSGLQLPPMSNVCRMKKEKGG